MTDNASFMAPGSRSNLALALVARVSLARRIALASSAPLIAWLPAVVRPSESSFTGFTACRVGSLRMPARG